MVIYSPLDNTRQITDPLELRRDCNKAYRDLNISNLEEEGGLSLDFRQTSKWQLITEHIINTPKVIDILKIRDTNQNVINTSENKMYETLWDIIAKFNFMPIQSDNITHYDGKIENRSIGDKVITDLKSYLEGEMIQTSSKQGVSDITFSTGGGDEDNRWACQIKDLDSGLPKPEPTFYLTSVKYFKKPKAIDRYDIEKLFTAYRDNSFFNDKNVEICVITNWSDEFKATMTRSVRKYISNQVYSF